MINYTLSNTLDLLNKYNLKAKISLGQNFLVDENVVNKIVNEVDKKESVAIIEVGSGLGALTSKLFDVCDKLVSIEIDQNMATILSDLFKEEEKFSIINEDVLSVDLEKIIKDLRLKYEYVYLVSNLPYYVTSKILMKSFVLKDSFDLILVMVQQEFGERLISKANDKQYRPISVIGQSFFKIKLMFNVSKNVFYPKPKVTSTIVKLVRNEYDLEDKEDYQKFVELCFIQRRKTLYNNLRNIYDGEFVKLILNKANIDMSLRAEDLKVSDYNRLYEVYLEEEIIRKA